LLRDGVMDGVKLRVCVSDGVLEDERVREDDCVGVLVSVACCDGVTEGVVDCDGVTDPVTD
jgi:hypothetical protein